MDNDFLNQTISDRIARIKENRSTDDVICLLGKYLTLDNLNSRFSIKIDPIRGRIGFKGNYEDTYELFKMTRAYSIEYFSVTVDNVVFDLTSFFTKLI